MPYSHKIILTLLLSITLALVVKGQSTISLSDVHSQLLLGSFAVETADYQKQIAEADYTFYKSQLKPGVNLTAQLPNFQKTSVPVTQPDGSITFQSVSQANSNFGLSASQVITATGGTVFATTQLSRFDNFSNESKQYNGIPVRVGLMQPIFGFNPWKYRKITEPLRLQESERQYQVATEQGLTQATDLYFAVLTADQDVKIASTNMEVNTNLLSITKERLLLGKVSKDQTLQLEMELNQARLSLSQAQLRKENAIAALYTYLGRDIPADGSFEIPTVLSAEVDVNLLMQHYEQARPELLAYQRDMAQADSDIAENKATFGAGATLLASFGLARGADNVDDVYTDPFTEQSVNVSINVPILDWGRKKSAVAKAQIMKQDAMASYEQQVRQLENGIQQRALAFEQLQKDVTLLQEIVELSAQRATISNERYVLGNIDITNLTIAQREKDQAARNYIQALRSLWVTYYELRALTGYDVVSNTKITYSN